MYISEYDSSPASKRDDTDGREARQRALYRWDGLGRLGAPTPIPTLQCCLCCCLLVLVLMLMLMLRLRLRFIVSWDCISAHPYTTHGLVASWYFGTLLYLRERVWYVLK